MVVPVSLLGRVLGEANMLQRPEIPVGEFLIEGLSDRLDIEGIVVTFLNLKGGDGE